MLFVWVLVSGYHVGLLKDTYDILGAILYPLAGGEQLTDEEYSVMPPKVRYLPPTKEREQDLKLKKVLLETLLQVC